jgi:hypothetical protein
MRPRHAAIYVALGIALGLCLHAAIKPKAAEVESVAPFWPAGAKGHVFV